MTVHQGKLDINLKKIDSVNIYFLKSLNQISNNLFPVLCPSTNNLDGVSVSAPLQIFIGVKYADNAQKCYRRQRERQD